jgi:RNA polymerase sigma factor (sigma-70 family)
MTSKISSVFVFCLLSFVSGLNSPKKTHDLAQRNYKLVPYFAKSYVKKYQLNQADKEEMIQYGYEGFMKACEKFDARKGFQLSTYSRFWIRKYMDDFIKDKMKKDKLYSDVWLKTYQEKETRPILGDYSLELWEKKLLYLKFFKKRSYKSIAKELKVSRETLRPVYYDIFKKIRSQELYDFGLDSPFVEDEK